MSRPKSARRVAVSRIEQRTPQERAAAFPLVNSEGREFDGISEAAARKTLALLLPDPAASTIAARAHICPLCGRGPFRGLVEGALA